MNQRGFTLVELLVALAVAGIVMSAVYLMYQSQLQTNATQMAVVEMNQHARAALMLLEREIRVAGVDPTGNAYAGFVITNPNEIQFTMDSGGGATDGIDNDKDGQTDEGDEWYDADLDDPNENIRYRLWADGGVDCDADNNGIADSFPCSLCRDTGGGLQRVADNVQALNFVYLDNAGDPTVTAADIRAVQVTLVVRSDNPVLMRDQTDRTVYTNLQGTTILPAQNDTIRRIMLSTEIRVRNTGIKS